MANKNPFGNIPVYGPGYRNTGMGKSIGMDKSGAKTSSSRGPSKAVMSEKTLDMRTAKAPSFLEYSRDVQAKSKVKIPVTAIADDYKKVFKIDPEKKGYIKPAPPKSPKAPKKKP